MSLNINESPVYCPINPRILLEETNQKLLLIETSILSEQTLPSNEILIAIQELQEMRSKLDSMNIKFKSQDTITGQIASIVFNPDNKRTKIRLKDIKKTFWVFGRLPNSKFNEGDKVDLEFEILLIRSLKRAWVTMIRPHEMKKNV